MFQSTRNRSPRRSCFDALIDLRDLELFRQRDRVALLAEVGAEQVRQVLHGGLRLRRVGSRQRRDRVHAVEEKVRADARLKRVHAGPGLHLHVALPFMRHVEVAQRQRS